MEKRVSVHRSGLCSCGKRQLLARPGTKIAEEILFERLFMVAFGLTGCAGAGFGSRVALVRAVDRASQHF